MLLSKTRFKQFTVLLFFSPLFSLTLLVLDIESCYCQTPVYDYDPRCPRPFGGPKAARVPANLPTFIILCKSRY